MVPDQQQAQSCLKCLPCSGIILCPANERCNIISHWLSSYTRWSLHVFLRLTVTQYHFCGLDGCLWNVMICHDTWRVYNLLPSLFSSLRLPCCAKLAWSVPYLCHTSRLQKWWTRGGISKTILSSSILEHIQFQCFIKIAPFNVWVRYFEWNFKGTLWNSAQNILPIHWKMWILSTGENLRALRFKSS